MQKDVFVIGSGQTRFGEWWDKSLHNLMQEAFDAAIDSSPCTALDIDMVIVANMLGELTNNQAHLGALASSLLPHQPPALRVEAACASGSIALHTACAMLESGRAETVAILGAEKMTDCSADEISNALMGAADSERDQPSGLTFPGIFGLIAKRYMHEFGLTRSQLNLVSARHHAHACENPYAQFRNAIAPGDVENSPSVAEPLHVLDCSPVSDGAAACILSTKHKSPVRLAASQIASDSLSITERSSLTSFLATKTAAENAFTEASVTNDDIRCIELHDCFSIAALINLEDLGFSEAGRGIEWYIEENPLITINGSGGLKACGHPVAATGIKQVNDIARKLMESKERFGLAQNFGGACATCGIHILEYAA
ncbi:hypothetical protein A2635_01955 [Candidatus Peribacteria bacterium RIFCSPHIGHO2_01_FULL_51_9]|nr:MAG: hypothetical protein A2635_01955 [Candidatus Peribacteria bacterium RIFCSPHIGHO2_01_FULL_51_9]